MWGSGKNGNKQPHYKKTVFCLCENKDADKLCKNALLISAFDFTTQIVQSLCFLYPKFQASSLFVRLYRSVYVGPGHPGRRFSHDAAEMSFYIGSFLILQIYTPASRHTTIRIHNCQLNAIASFVYSFPALSESKAVLLAVRHPCLTLNVNEYA